MQCIESQLLLNLPRFDNRLARWGAREFVVHGVGEAVRYVPGAAIAGQLIGINAQTIAKGLMDELGI